VQSTEPVLVALAAQHAELARLIDPLGDQAWRAPTPCPGWDVADVVFHLAQTDEAAIASAEGRLGTLANGTLIDDSLADVDELAERMVVEARTMTPSSVLARWHAASEGMQHAFLQVAPDARCQWVVGTFTARTLATTRLSEAWIHTGDVAAALGVEPELDDRIAHIARLAWRTVPYAFARAGHEAPGPVGFDLVLPSGAPCALGLEDAVTVVRGRALDLCRVAGQRADAADTALVATGPDAEAVLELVRTFA
jgi:uncharacterized protein (TIGR03084 family)